MANIDRFNLQKVLKAFHNVDISLDMANVAKNEFLGNFRAQGFGSKGWKDVKRRTHPTARDIKTGGSTRAILQGKGSGRLRKDLANSVSTGTKNNKRSYTLVVNNEYAIYHNEGTKHIPQRQFVGLTKGLNEKLLRKIDQKMRKIWETY